MATQEAQTVSRSFKSRNYRWVILAAAFILQMLALGTTTFAFGLFVKPVSAEMNIPRGSVNLGLILLLLGSALASPFIGRLLDRFPTRWIILGGSLLFGLGTTWLATSSQLWAVSLALFGPIAIGVAALSSLTSSILITRWFDDRVGRALGIVGISASAGGAMVVPMLSHLIEANGWRSATMGAGLFTAAIGTMVALFLVPERPRQQTETHAKPGTNEGLWTLRSLFLTRDFWLLAMTVGSLFAINQTILSALVAYGQDLGFSATKAALLVSAVSISSIVGKLATGFLSDFVDKRLLLAAAASLLGIFLAILLARPSYNLLLLGCLLSGAAVGGTTPIWVALIFRRFGAVSFGLAMGLMIQVQTPLMLMALRVVGVSYDANGSYDHTFQYFLLSIPVIIFGIFLIGRPQYKHI